MTVTARRHAYVLPTNLTVSVNNAKKKTNILFTLMVSKTRIQIEKLFYS